MVILGITGSIGVGKTTTADMFRRRGVPVWGADAAVHRLYAGPAASLIEAEFPGTTVNGVVDRDRLSRAVIDKPDDFRRLEAIIHPLVGEDRQAFIAGCRQRYARAVGLDIPLLFETGGQDTVDARLVVTASPEVQKSRVLARQGMTEERFAAILARQTPDTEKRAKAHFIVDTGHGMASAESQVSDIVAVMAVMA